MDSKGSQADPEKIERPDSTHRPKSGNKRQRSMGKKVSAIGFWTSSELASLSDNVDQLKLPDISPPARAQAWPDLY